MKKRSSCRLLFLSVMLFLSFLFAGCTPDQEIEPKKIIIGSKNFTEQEVLGELMAILIEEHTDITVSRAFNLGGTMVCFNALRTGDLDLYAEYTGTGLVNILKLKAKRDPDITYKTVRDAFLRDFNLLWLKPFGFNNTYALTMRKDKAESLGIIKISDLESHKEEVLSGFTAEFMQRPDGYPGLISHYGFEFGKAPRQLDPGLMYRAVSENAVDIVSAFATDGRIPAYDLLTLEDDKQFFPPYYAAPLIKKETLTEYPELEGLLNRLHGKISDAEMRELNYGVDEGERAPADVAREFLRSKGLIP